MLQNVVDALSCPHGEPALASDVDGLVCPAGHRFDRARQGYVNLLTGPAPAAADTAAMVTARERIQSAGHHEVLTDALVRAASTLPGEAVDGLVVDLGAGTGHHLRAVVEGTGAVAGLALDISKYAARRASRVHPRVEAIVADVWQPLPLRDAVASVVLDVFAPRNVAEIARILVPGGRLIVATPTAQHLAPLVERLGLLRVGDAKLDRLDRDLAEAMVLRTREVAACVVTLGHDAVADVVAMGPSAHHLDPHDLAARINALREPLEVTIAVTVSVYHGRGAHPRPGPRAAARYPRMT